MRTTPTIIMIDSFYFEIEAVAAAIKLLIDDPDDAKYGMSARYLARLYQCVPADIELAARSIIRENWTPDEAAEAAIDDVEFSVSLREIAERDEYEARVARSFG